MRRLVLLAMLVVLVVLVGCGDGAQEPPIDAPTTAPCGLPLPGSRCTSGTVLERCDGTSRQQVDCTASGMVCGTDTNDPAQAACVASGASCGLVTGGGVCNGDVLTRCSRDGALRVIDCGGRGARCGFYEPTEKYECTDDCRDMVVSAEGECTANLRGITRCVYADGTFVVRTDTCPDGSFCRDTGADTGDPSCSPLCAGIGLTGRCAGDVVDRCVGSNIQSTDCAATGEVCAWSAVAGYACVPPGKVGNHRVIGRVTYEDRAAVDGVLGQISPKRVRGAAVSLIADADGRVIASAVTDDNGDYTVRYSAPNGTRLRVLVVSASFAPERPVRVLRPDGLLHSFASPSFELADLTTMDVLVSERSGVAEAFNILDVMVAGQDMVRTQLGVAQPHDVAVIWAMDSAVGTFTQSSTIYLLGGLDFRNQDYDDDGYDDAVMGHEFGHTMEFNYGATSNPGLFHGPFIPAVPTLAWSEGFADWTSSAVRGDPVYTDTNGLGGFSFEIDATATLAKPTMPETQQLSENTVAELLWDLSDAPPDDDDPVAGTPGAVLSVEPGYLRAPAVDRGVSGIDLVDFLDGYFVVHGTGACDAVRSVVASRGFPYDFAGPTPCP